MVQPFVRITCQFQGLVNPQVNLSSVMIRNPVVGNSLEQEGESAEHHKHE
jgi:hypothetical protein